MGSLQTGYHNVDIRVTSVAGFLPSVEDNDATFLGTTGAVACSVPALTPVEEAAMRRKGHTARIISDSSIDFKASPTASPTFPP